MHWTLIDILDWPGQINLSFIMDKGRLIQTIEYKPSRHD